MKIAFFTEANFTGKIPRSFDNCRTEYAWYIALDADHLPIGAPIVEQYDLGIVILPKKNIEQLMQIDLISHLKKSCKKVAVMQEGPNWYFQDYPLVQQIWYFNTLQGCDFIFAHNELDQKYYTGLTGKDCYIMNSLMIEDTIEDLPDIDRENVMIGGNFCSWYGGFDSYIVAQELECKIAIPSMGRKQEGEEKMPNLNHLPYMNWTEWIKTLNKFKYGIHLMRTHAAGTFALNCAYLGIPCIGYKGLDTQELCHPLTTVELGDLESAVLLANKLKDDKFYKVCSERTKKRYYTHFEERLFQERFKLALKREGIDYENN
jgi:hypothetical protein